MGPSLHSARGSARWIAATAAVLALMFAGTDADAADKSGVRPEVVYLPDGPGSIRGYGPDFQPDLPSGTASFDFQLEMPKGPGGLPSVSMGYDSGSGNSVMGIGWGISMPRIERKTLRPFPRYVDADNGIDDDFDGDIDEPDERDKIRVYAAGGPENLVEEDDLSDDDNLVFPPGEFYFAKFEGAFIRYQRIEDYWEGVRPNGTRLEFGKTEATRVVDPDDPARVFAWLLENEIDVNGNVIAYEYERGTDEDNRATLYLKAIRYGAGAPPWEHFHFVTFEYEDREDVFESGLPGFLTRMGKRLAQVTTGTQTTALDGHLSGDFDGDGMPDFLNRRYDFAYDADPYWSLLSSIQITGADGATALPPLSFGWRVCDPPESVDASGATLGETNAPSKLFDDPAVDLAELNGDGLPDLLETQPEGGVHRAYFNRGESTLEDESRVITWSEPVDVGGDERAHQVDLASTGRPADLADISGDGFSDLTYTAEPFQVYHFPISYENGLPTWGERIEFNLFDGESAPPSPYGNSDVKRTDINGDKSGDVIQTSVSGNNTLVRIWYNLGGKRYSRPVAVTQTFNYRFSMDGVAFHDFNADGINDFTRVRPTTIEVAPGLGYGKFADVRTVEIPDFTLVEPWLGRATFEDITGDGLPDLVIERGAVNTLWYWVNLGNYTLDSRREVTGLPPAVGFNVDTRWADMNGNGSTDLVLVDQFNNPRITTIDIGELIGCVPAPNLLIHIDNGLGRTTDITYNTSADFALEAEANGTPWPDPVPVVVDVVTNVDNFDSFGNEYNETFAYNNGYWSTRFKIFNGFGAVTYQDIGESTAPTEVKKYTFLVGRDSNALKGKKIEETSEDTDGNVVWRETTDWELRELGTGDTGETIEVAFPTKVMREILERGNGTPLTILKEMDYDDYGNLIEERDYGVVDGEDLGAFGDERISTMEYAINVDTWVIRNTSRVELANLDGELIKRTDTYYDDETFGGDNLGEVTIGRKTLVRRWLDPQDTDDTIDSSRVQYDAFGNPVVMLDPLGVAPGGLVDTSAGHVREIVYDDAFQTFPTQETLHVGGDQGPLVISASYDPGFANATDATDVNGNLSRYRYDALGRLTASLRPDDSDDLPSIEYDYVLGIDTGDGIISYVETRILDNPDAAASDRDAAYRFTRSYVNGLGEVVLDKEEAEVDPDSNESRVVVKNAVVFNGRGLARYKLNPFFTDLTGTLEERLAFEDVRAGTWSGSFHLAGSLESLGFTDAHKGETLYDVALRAAVINNADGSFRSTEFEPLVMILSDENDTDPDSPHADTPKLIHRDGQDRIVQVDETARLNEDGTSEFDINTFTTMFTYRADGERMAITDHQQNVRRWNYDGIGRKLLVNDPNRGITRFSYDAASNLLTRIDASGRATRMTYDGLNRRLTEDYVDEDEPFSSGLAFDPEEPISEDNRADIVYFYDVPFTSVDLGNGTTGDAENTAGKLAGVWDLAGEQYSSYDVRGRLDWVVRSLVDPRSGESVPYRTDFEYDTVDRTTAMTYPDGDRVAYEYNERNLLASISGGALSNRGDNDGVVILTGYTPSGQRTQYAYGNGVTALYGYDARKRLTSLQALNADRTDLIRNAYDYDGLSNVLSIIDGRDAEIIPEEDARRNSQLFVYDDLYRLVGASYAFDTAAAEFGNNGVLAYRYDSIGNMLAKNSDIEDSDGRFSITNLGDLTYGGASGASGRDGRAFGDAPGPQALTALDDGTFNRTLTYDDQGNMTLRDGLSLTWDFNNRLRIAEDDDFRSEYSYDYAGLRKLKTIYAKTDGVVAPEPLEVVQYVAKYFEVREGEQPVKYVFDGGRRIARAVGTLDASAERTQRFRFAPGWNLAALGVEATDAAVQLGVGSDSRIIALVVWEPETGEYLPPEESDPMAASDIFWIHVDEPLHAQVTGMLPADAEAEAQSGFNALTAFRALRAEVALPADIPFAWAHDDDAQEWQARLGGDNSFLSEWPEFIAAGQPVYLAFDDAPALGLPDAALDLQYYHPDHLGSASVVADAEGNPIEEIAYYPFGTTRNQWQAESAAETVPNPYSYAQKERDDETGLHYFDARYLDAPLGRFNRVDPALDDLPQDAIEDPQHLHAYAFARNNPINYTDPDGQFAFNRAQKVLIRQLNPFSDQASGNLTDDKTERRARVFGALSLDKGGKIFENIDLGGISLPYVAQQEVSKLKKDLALSPNQLISDVEKVLLDLKGTKLPGGKELNVDSFLKAITTDPDSSEEGQQARLKAFGQLGFDPDDLSDSPITESGSLVNEGFAKQIEQFQTQLKSLDLESTLSELTAKGESGLGSDESKGFSFSQDDIDDFIDRFLGGADEAVNLNRREEQSDD